MVVKHNITAMNSNRMLGLTTSSQAKSTEKLSSGYKINRAADDAAGLSISEKMRRQIRGLTQASANAQDGISCVQTAEGALNEIHDMLQRINELAVKGETGTQTSVDRNYIAAEVRQLLTEIDRVQSTTTFNEQSLLDGTFKGKGLQVGAEAGQHIAITIKNMSANDLIASAAHKGVKFTVNHADSAEADDVATKAELKSGENTFNASMLYAFYAYDKGGISDEYATDETGINAAEGKNDAETTMGTMPTTGKYKPYKSRQEMAPTSQEFAALNAFAKSAIQDVSQQRSDLGAVQNRLEHTVSNLDNIVENTTSAEAQIRDTDIATEMVKYANNNI
ncbi:MAG: flagellin, partial [Roseburia sp.]|nr:flagellin [Roseburia sp.]